MKNNSMITTNVFVVECWNGSLMLRTTEQRQKWGGSIIKNNSSVTLSDTNAHEYA